MIFMFCKFPDIAAGNFGDVISTSTFTLYAGRYIHRLLNGDYLLIGLYFGGVFLIGVTLLYGLIKIFRNWYSNDAIQGSKSQPVDWNKETTEQHSPVSALLERERTRYFSLPVYLTNTACGLLFAAVFVLLVVLMSDKITPYIYQLAEYFQVPFADYDVLFIYAFSILTTISCTTYVSISIEGKQIEILKSLPIAAKCLFRVKLLHHLSMSVPTIFVLNTIMALYLQWSFPKAMLGYAFPLLCSVLIVGLGQAIATMPGISRSGMTITTGCFVGFERKFAVRFSFLLSIPAVLGANILSLADAAKAGINWAEVPVYLVGVVTAAVVGYLCIRLLRFIADRGKFGAFAYYCWAVGVLTLVLNVIK